MTFLAPILIASVLPSLQAPQPLEGDPPALVVVPKITAFFPTVRGRIQADEATFPQPIVDGTNISYESDLHLDDEIVVPVIEIVAYDRVGDRRVTLGSVSYFEAGFEGSTRFSSSERFNGRTFAAGTQVDSTVRYRLIGGDYAVGEFLAPFFEETTGTFMIGARYTEHFVKMEGGGVETDERLRLFYIGAAFRGETRWGPFSAALQAGIYGSFGGYGDYYDYEFEEWGATLFEGSVSVAAAFGPLILEAGWKYLSDYAYADRDDGENFEENDFEIQLDGPYFGLTLRL